nr:MAG TPA: endonuclease [Caudoviricetes sp.]
MNIVPLQYASQTCSRCDCMDKRSRQTQARFKCTACGFEINADHNAALNFLAAGQRPWQPVEDVKSICYKIAVKIKYTCRQFENATGEQRLRFCGTVDNFRTILIKYCQLKII